MVSVDKDIQRIIDLVKKNGIGELEIHDGKRVIRVQAAPTPVRVESAPPLAAHPHQQSRQNRHLLHQRMRRLMHRLLALYLTPSPDERPLSN